MSRLTDKIDKLRNEISDIEDKVESLEAKQRKSNFKKNRKQYRKKYANDPAFRCITRWASDLEKDMYGGGVSDNLEFTSILERLDA